MKKLDTSILETYTKKQITEFHKEINLFINKEKRNVRKEAIIYFYLLAYKLENK